MGKTSLKYSVRITAWKHPHVHGEDSINAILFVVRLETPPRAWGRLPP